MKKSIYIVLFVLAFSGCKNSSESQDEKPRSAENIQHQQADIADTKDFPINKIETSAIGKEILGNQKKEIITNYFEALNRSFDRHGMADGSINLEDALANVAPQFSVFDYEKIKIATDLLDAYVVKIKYEDASYESILVISSNDKKVLDNSLLIYENLKSEENYVATSSLSENIIVVKSKSKVQKFLLKDKMFLDYFDEKNKDFNKEWGNKEEMPSESGISLVFQYKMKGSVKNHLKEGDWEERKYSPEYHKSVWINGKYIQGKKTGEWYYSPDGPAEKIEIYDNGRLLETNKI